MLIYSVYGLPTYAIILSPVGLDRLDYGIEGKLHVEKMR